MAFELDRLDWRSLILPEGNETFSFFILFSGAAPRQS